MGRCLVLLTAVFLIGCEAQAATPDAADVQPAQDAQVALDALPDLTAEPCNGAPELCHRRFDEVAYACAHNGMSNADEGWILPNQRHGLVRQLDDGIRGFMIDVHVYNGDDAALAGKTMLCHGTCDLGYEGFASALAKMKAWLDAHPREVIAFILEDHVAEDAIDAALTESGMLGLCLHQDKGKPFPTLAEMIAANRRVFVMTESGGGAKPWHHGYEDFSWDTPYAAETAADFSCELLRGKKDNPLFVVNHFLTNMLQAHDLLAEQVNHSPLLHDRIAQCAKEADRMVNFVAVDYYDVGDVLTVVRQLNHLAP